MLTLTQRQLRAVLLARGDDPRPFTKALWITERFVMCTDGCRMHLLVHGQEWSHGNVAVPLQIAHSATGDPVVITQRTFAGVAFLPVMGATLPPVDRFLPDLPAQPATGAMRCSIGHEYLSDARQAIDLVRDDGQDPCMHMTDGGAWTWSNGRLLVCIAPLKGDGVQVQLKGLD